MNPQTTPAPGHTATDYLNRKIVEETRPRSLSWRPPGPDSSGVGYVKMSLNPDGSLDIKVAEWPKNAKGGKEVYGNLSKERADQLGGIICASLLRQNEELRIALQELLSADQLPPAEMNAERAIKAMAVARALLARLKEGGKV